MLSSFRSMLGGGWRRLSRLSKNANKLAFHFFEANGFFLAPFSHNGQIMQIFHQTLITLERKKHPRFFAFRIHYELFQTAIHFAPLCWTSAAALALAYNNRIKITIS